YFVMLADNHIYDIPEDDFGTLGLYEDQRNDVPYHPTPSNPISTLDRRTNGSCCTCLIANATHMFVPCGHLCICTDCKERLEDDNCPLCRVEYNSCIRAIIT
ncbi:Baculoviral IAP repeat-containing protein 7-B, partial [Trachymyrmex cornetzi]